ncbi:MAG: hypothetical protein HLUCCX10_13860 [Algoriphagus marincola HL-49]|uniref:Uncharacterized protein n=1 Tax=Algoriphagus marincola HL-49 TaxID=1305737 RepID=A0A0P8A612_9BACT|nr:MAG: hypothetical protein HLUCCX10_13860 [Algoriphagus marincola HL-49]
MLIGGAAEDYAKRLQLAIWQKDLHKAYTFSKNERHTRKTFFLTFKFET